REEDVCVVAMTAGASEAKVVTCAIEALSFENDHIKLATSHSGYPEGPRRTPKDPKDPEYNFEPNWQTDHDTPAPGMQNGNLGPTSRPPKTFRTKDGHTRA
ncbi:hypothetical protein LTR16_005134, partial [Cryomyces antarcticus]